MSLDDCISLQKKVERLRQEAARTEGSLQQLLEELRTELAQEAADPLQLAQEQISRLQQEEDRLAKKASNLQQRWEEKYGDRFA